MKEVRHQRPRVVRLLLYEIGGVGESIKTESTVVAAGNGGEVGGE